MKAVLFLCLCWWFVSPAFGQARGHYDLVSVNETIREADYAVTIVSWEQQKVEVSVDKRAGTPLEIRLRAADRQVLASERAGRLNQRFDRVLNLSQLESGRYWLEVQVGRHLIRRELKLESTEQTYRSLSLH
jgi:hypothetical protein